MTEQFLERKEDNSIIQYHTKEAIEFALQGKNHQQVLYQLTDGMIGSK